MIQRPDRSEAADLFWTYIGNVPDTDLLPFLGNQALEATELLAGISERRSFYRYAPEKWSIREVLNHVTDTERVFVLRALWFARGLPGALPSFDQDAAVAGAKADGLPLAAHLEEFKQVRRATMSLFSNLPDAAWLKTGTAGGREFTVRALAFIAAGHAEHHLTILKQRYLQS